MTVAKQQPLSAELIDSLLSGYKKPEDLIGEHGLLKQLTKALVERALEAEMEAHLGHARSEAVTNSAGNTRNGMSKKTLKRPRKSLGGLTPSAYAAQLAGKSVTLTTDSKALSY